MPTEAATKTKRETWRDPPWSPIGAPEPSRLLTRPELLDLLAQMGVDATEADLRYWEYEGVLPRALRRWVDGAPRALYADWVAYFVKHLRQLQRDEGLSLAEIRPRLRTYARLFHAHDGTTRVPADLPRTPDQIRPWPALVTELGRLARWWASLSDDAVDLVEVRVVGETGRSTVYQVPATSFGGGRKDASRVRKRETCEN